MKKHFIIFLIGIFVCINAYGRQVCSVPVTGTEYAYSIIDGESPELVHWAVGAGCTADTSAQTIGNMCTDIIAAGDAFCASRVLNGSGKFNHTVERTGSACWCRRTHVYQNDALTDSIGQWVLLGRFPEIEACYVDCAKYCARNVSENFGGMRNAIMLLPSLI